MFASITNGNKIEIKMCGERVIEYIRDYESSLFFNRIYTYFDIFFFFLHFSAKVPIKWQWEG